jgi:hypothetical protein
MGFTPKIDQEGNVLATQNGDEAGDPAIAAVGNIEDQTETNLIELDGTIVNPGMLHNGNVIVGTNAAIQKRDIATGNLINKIETDNRADILKIGDTGFSNRPEGMEKYDLNNLNDSTTLNMPGNPTVYATTAIENGELLPMIGGQGLSSYDTSEGEILDTIDIDTAEVASTDGDYLYGLDDANYDIFVAEIPKEPGETWSIQDEVGFGETLESIPIVVDDSGSDVWLYAANPTDGDGNSPINAYTFDGNSLTEEWTTEVPGVTGSLSKVGDTVIRGGVGFYLLDGETGEIRDQAESAIGRASIMYNNLLAYNDPNNGGIHIYEMQMEDVSPGPSPNIDLSFSGLPEDPVTQGTTTTFDFTIQNSGDGEFVGDVAFEYTAGDAADTYTDSITETIAAGITLTIDHEYTPSVFGESSFSFEYDAATDTITVTVPVEIDGDQTEANITGSSSTS